MDLTLSSLSKIMATCIIQAKPSANFFTMRGSSEGLTCCFLLLCSFYSLRFFEIILKDRKKSLFASLWSFKLFTWILLLSIVFYPLFWFENFIRHCFCCCPLVSVVFLLALVLFLASSSNCSSRTHIISTYGDSSLSSSKSCSQVTGSGFCLRKDRGLVEYSATLLRRISAAFGSCHLKLYRFSFTFSCCSWPTSRSKGAGTNQIKGLNEQADFYFQS